MEIIETIKGEGGLVANLYQDDCPDSPREWDNLGVIATVHLRQNELRDKGEPYLPEDLEGWDQVAAYLRRERGAAVVLPVFLYSHSGEAISTRSFVGRAQHASWDSGRVGFIYATTSAILKEYGGKRLTEASLAKASACLESEIETFNQYIQGDVYAYQIIREAKCVSCGNDNTECLDSCGGFYGYEYAKKEAKSALEAAARRA